MAWTMSRSKSSTRPGWPRPARGSPGSTRESGAPMWRAAKVMKMSKLGGRSTGVPWRTFRRRSSGCISETGASSEVTEPILRRRSSKMHRAFFPPARASAGAVPEERLPMKARSGLAYAATRASAERSPGHPRRPCAQLQHLHDEGRARHIGARLSHILGPPGLRGQPGRPRGLRVGHRPGRLGPLSRGGPTPGSTWSSPTSAPVQPDAADCRAGHLGRVRFR